MSKPTPDSIYVGSNSQRFYIEDVWDNDEDDFYLVCVVKVEDKDDMSAIVDELDNKQWESIVEDYGLTLETK